MSRPAVEFLDPTGQVRTDAEPADVPRPRRATALAVAGWLAAAGLAVAAPFATTYRADYSPPAGPTVRASVDGWGRSHTQVPVQNLGAHGIRIGFALVVLAALLVALAAQATWRFRRNRSAKPFGRLAVGISVAVGGALAATAGSLWLSIDSVLSTYREINRANLLQSGSDTPVPTFQTHLGPSLWLVLAATAVAAASCAVVSARNRPGAAVTEDTPEPATEPLPPLDGAELLG